MVQQRKCAIFAVMSICSRHEEVQEFLESCHLQDARSAVPSCFFVALPSVCSIRVDTCLQNFIIYVNIF